jgi:hypothetical protein
VLSWVAPDYKAEYFVRKVLVCQLSNRTLLIPEVMVGWCSFMAPAASKIIDH